MTNEELQAIRAIIKEELDPIKKEISTIGEDLEETREEISGIKEEISIIKEDLEEVRTGVNTLLDWAERTSHVLEFPLPKVIE